MIFYYEGVSGFSNILEQHYISMHDLNFFGPEINMAIFPVNDFIHYEVVHAMISAFDRRFSFNDSRKITCASLFENINKI